MDIVTTSPTPMGSGSHFTSLGRRTSARQALRRPPSRSQLSRSETNPSGAPSATTTAKDSRSQSQPQSQQYSTLNDSSDDEIPVPMKLSALTKALLNDSHASRASSLAASAAAAERPSSPPGRPASRIMTRRGALATTFSAAEDREQRRESVRQRPETRRHVRAGSAQLPSSRPSSPMRSGGENSPPQRKRVVRLSNTPGNGNGLQQGLRRSLSASTQRKRLESRERSEEKNKALLQQQQQQQQPQPQPQQPQQHQEHQEQLALQLDTPADVNTPVVPVRTVRIAVGSSDKSRSGGSSGVSSRRSAGNSDQEMPEDPATVGRPQAAAPQSSMRIKRVAKVPGSFLSGPARRGRRRQSEEDAQEQGEGGDMMWSSQEPESQQAHDMEPALGEQPASSFVAASYRDFAASGSPVSAKDSARAAIRRQASQASLSGSGSGSAVKAQPERSHLELAYKVLAPPANHVSMDGQDKENEAPPTFKRAKPALAIASEKDDGKPAQPLSVAMAAAPQQRPASPERKVLAPKSHNTPHRVAPPPPPKMSVVETATAAAGASATAQGSKKRQVLLRVNGRTYTRIDCIGRGGTSKVYRVSAENGTTLALKRVTLEKADENMVKGFKGEIDLLKRLHGVERVIQLIDHELNLEKQMLSVLMEVGELDFHTLLRSRQCGPEGARLDPVFIRYYWKEMLECVQAVHARDVVHSDLKPANFVLVKGRLKLIDFGIANAIQTEMTVNVHRETQIGTPNYMSPESLMDSNQYAFTSAHNGKFCVPPPLGAAGYQRGMPKLMKLGKPSDVWSLGCILYQMVYGTPPFGRIANQMSRCQAIINWAYQIEFPETTEDGGRVPPSVIRTMRRCLNREQKERPTCDELLADSDPFLYPQEFDPSVYAAAAHDKVLPMTEELLSRIIQSVVQRCKERLPTEGEAISTWPNAYWASVRKAVGGAGNASKS